MDGDDIESRRAVAENAIRQGRLSRAQAKRNRMERHLPKPRSVRACVRNPKDLELKRASTRKALWKARRELADSYVRSKIKRKVGPNPTPAQLEHGRRRIVAQRFRKLHKVHTVIEVLLRL